ncbi:hypothetical protein BDB01DRAFT_779580 [Pilobolus umbonatus]|nr:hypothetical protein BDB01DRAFT_779580 [Pilobolus umbonatus]
MIAHANEFNWDLIKSEIDKEAVEAENKYQKEENHMMKIKEPGVLIKRSADYAYKELSSVVLNKHPIPSSSIEHFFTTYTEQWKLQNKTNQENVSISFIHPEQSSLAGSTCRIKICVHKTLSAELELEYERESDTLSIHQYNIGSLKEQRPTSDDSQYLVFRKINLLATKAFEDMLVFFAKESLFNILDWFASYHDLFNKPCHRCHKLLQYDSPQYKHLPPMVRTWAKKSSLFNVNNTQQRQTGIAYHMRCSIEHKHSKLIA